MFHCALISASLNVLAFFLKYFTWLKVEIVYPSDDHILIQSRLKLAENTVFVKGPSHALEHLYMPVNKA